MEATKARAVKEKFVPTPAELVTQISLLTNFGQLRTTVSKMTRLTIMNHLMRTHLRITTTWISDIGRTPRFPLLLLLSMWMTR